MENIYGYILYTITYIYIFIYLYMKNFLSGKVFLIALLILAFLNSSFLVILLNILCTTTFYQIIRSSN